MLTALVLNLGDTDDLGDAFILGSVSGMAAGTLTGGFGEKVHSAIYGRILALKDPLMYMQNYPADLLAGTLLYMNKVGCKKKDQLSSVLGGTCDL
ncbi:hypothetical protein [Bacteriovorax sp. DB6_IX]|uniref:hypothetical protein n=1 Tax=Bacteriovorax sp. DB6_IX TaxID=1353530 RepID=UPI000389EABE|nr:hypothetical protein [Bacteriovorax sp. DB6_IX]EQC50418.1 hypothetical protein M901_0161 [Bacteriovorax sp. DB6_IX]